VVLLEQETPASFNVDFINSEVVRWMNVAGNDFMEAKAYFAAKNFRKLEFKKDGSQKVWNQ